MRIDLGSVSAYSIAVKNGFTGTEAEWMQAILNAGENAQSAAESAQEASENAMLAENSATSAEESAEKAKIQFGSPLVAHLVTDMEDENRVYVYVGEETGYTAGNWYYYNGSEWISGGIYNGEGVNTDPSLSIEDMPADAKVVGNEFTNVRQDLSEPSRNLFGFKNEDPITSNHNGVDITYSGSTIKLNGTATANYGAKWTFGGLAYGLNANVGDELTLSYEKVGGSYSGGNPYLSLNNVSDTSIRLDLRTQRTFAYTSTMSSLQIYFASGMVFDNFVINVQIEKGNQATPFCKYGGGIANDKIARAEIAEIDERLIEHDTIINQIEENQLVTDKYMSWVVGIINVTTGLPQNATYRIRTTDYIPFSAFYKMTWDAGYKTIVTFYGEDYSYLGYMPQTDVGVITKDDLKILQNNIYYIKIIFANPSVSAVTTDVLEEGHFVLYTLNSQNNSYKDFIENDIPYSWVVPYRNILQMQGDGFTFAIQTDTHYNKEIPPYYDAMKNLSRRIGFDFIANLGDIIRGYEYDTVADSYEEYKKAIRGLVDGAECSTFALMGNHDNNAMYATATSTIGNAFLPAELFALFERPTTTEDNAVVWGSREGLYFYRDFDDVRVIVLNTSDIPYQSLSTSDISVSRLEISNEQIEWFTNTALNTTKQVLILSHAPLNGSITVHGRDAVISAISDYVTGGGVVIACVAGHTHSLDATVVDGVNHIICDNGGEICEIFAVDLENRTISTQQIGQDFTGNRSFTY